MKQKLTLIAVAVLMTFGLSSVAARADTVTLTLSNPTQSVSGATGGTLIYTATVTAPLSNGATVYLNGDSAGLTSPLVVDDSDFFANYPFSLDPGDSFTGDLFSVTVPPGTTPGNYLGFFTLQGGVDGGAADDLADLNFTVVALGATPEPSSFLLFGSGLTGLLCMVRRKRTE